MSFELARPSCLFLLLLFAGLWWGYRRSLIDFGIPQRLASLAVRTLLLSLLVLAIAGLTLRYSSHEKMLVILLDRSRSIDDTAARLADTTIAAIDALEHAGLRAAMMDAVSAAYRRAKEME